MQVSCSDRSLTRRCLAGWKGTKWCRRSWAKWQLQQGRSTGGQRDALRATL